MEYGFKEGERRQIGDRIRDVLDKLQKAIKQAHELIIGERLVRNEDKLLSLYEDDLHVCVKGKAGIPAEFGNTLVIAEQSNGIIVDWQCYKEQAPGEAKLLKTSLLSLLQKQTVKSTATDRGMMSKQNQEWLNKNHIDDYMCPRSPEELANKQDKTVFREKQKRRVGTEARIGILKNKFLGQAVKSNGFNRRYHLVHGVSSLTICGSSQGLLKRRPKTAQKRLNKPSFS